jgi:hypothetical protein
MNIPSQKIEQSELEAARQSVYALGHEVQT